jgi:hypothetical protein
MPRRAEGAARGGLWPARRRHDGAEPQMPFLAALVGGSLMAAKQGRSVCGCMPIGPSVSYRQDTTAAGARLPGPPARGVASGRAPALHQGSVLVQLTSDRQLTSEGSPNVRMGQPGTALALSCRCHMRRSLTSPHGTNRAYLSTSCGDTLPTGDAPEVPRHARDRVQVGLSK